MSSHSSLKVSNFPNDINDYVKLVGVIKLTEAKKAEVECADYAVNVKDDGVISVDPSQDKAKTKQQKDIDTDHKQS